MTRTRERLEAAATLAAMLAQEPRIPDSGAASCWIVGRDAVQLMKLARRAERIALNQCNGIERYDAKAGRVLASWTEQDQDRAEKARTKIAAAVMEIGARYAFKGCSVHGDPRGFVLRIDVASGRKNGMGDGWGVSS